VNHKRNQRPSRSQTRIRQAPPPARSVRAAFLELLAIHFRDSGFDGSRSRVNGVYGSTTGAVEIDILYASARPLDPITSYDRKVADQVDRTPPDGLKVQCGQRRDGQQSSGGTSTVSGTGADSTLLLVIAPFEHIACAGQCQHDADASNHQ